MCKGIIGAMLLTSLFVHPVTAGCNRAAQVSGTAGRFLVLAEGDSITFGQAATDGLGSYVSRSCVLKVKNIEISNGAVSRAVLGSKRDAPGSNSLYGRLAADNALLAGKAGRIAILTLLIGRNDLVGYQGGADAYTDDLVKYIRAMRSAGWDRVVVGTVLPSTWEPFDPARDDLNSILTMPGWAKAHGIDAIANFAAMPTMGRDGQAANTAFYADGIHPTNRGYETMSSVYDAALREVMTAPH